MIRMNVTIHIKGGEAMTEKAINLRGVSEALHKRIKLQAVSEGRTMQELILEAVEAYLKKKGA